MKTEFSKHKATTLDNLTKYLYLLLINAWKFQKDTKITRLIDKSVTSMIDQFIIAFACM